MSLQEDIEKLKKQMVETNPFYEDVINNKNKIKPNPISPGSTSNSKIQNSKDNNNVKDKNDNNKKNNENKNENNGNHNTSNTSHTNHDGDSQNKESEKNPILNQEDIIQQQKENTVKQQIVKQSLLERQKRLMFEQEKLDKCNEELQNMENILVKDVEKLREIIETISNEIVFYEKDYNDKRKAYLESKKQLRSLRDRQTQLTKHLYTIISSNELRKKQTLEELMKQLEVSQEMLNGNDNNDDDNENNNDNHLNNNISDKSSTDNKYKFSGFPDEALN